MGLKISHSPVPHPVLALVPEAEATTWDFWASRLASQAHSHTVIIHAHVGFQIQAVSLRFSWLGSSSKAHNLSHCMREGSEWLETARYVILINQIARTPKYLSAECPSHRFCNEFLDLFCRQSLLSRIQIACDSGARQFFFVLLLLRASLGGTGGKELACPCRRHRFHLWVRKIPWSRKRQPTPVFLSGKSHGQRSLVGYSPCVTRESVKAEWLSTHRVKG